jgi:hypothetical protein
MAARKRTRRKGGMFISKQKRGAREFCKSSLMLERFVSDLLFVLFAPFCGDSSDRLLY